MIGVLASSSSVSSSSSSLCKKEVSFACNEPISVLDTRRSPSPSTSTSTLSSLGGTNGGGIGSTENGAVVAAVSDNTTQQKWLKGSLPPETGGALAVSETAGCGRKEEWASELQPIPAGLDMGSRISERIGLGLEDWETLFSEPEALPGQDQSLLRWIAGDADEASFSLKQLLQSGSGSEIDGNVGFFAINNQSSGSGTIGNFSNNLNNCSSAISGSGFSLENNFIDRAPQLISNSSNNLNLNPQNPSFNVLALPPEENYQNLSANSDQKPQIFNPNFQILGNSNFISPPEGYAAAQFEPQLKRHNPGFQISKLPFLDPGHDFLIRKPQSHLGFPQQFNLQKPLMVPKMEAAAGGGGCGSETAVHHHHLQQQQQQEEVVYDNLFKAAELILAGNFSLAQGILARLNHQLSSTVVKPFQRSALYFTEALQFSLLFLNPENPPPARIPTPVDGMFKMAAYKHLSDSSPIIQFTNFTANQLLLEALGDADRIHVIDFDIGFGAQWASFMMELPKRRTPSGTSPELKITAFASPATHHHIEIGLMHENLTQFANELGVSFELEIVNFDAFDPTTFLVSAAATFRSLESEAIAVNFPMWAVSNRLSIFPSLLRFIKQLSPKIVVSSDYGFEKFELPFSHHLLHALQYHNVLLDSIDAANLSTEASNKIEKFIIQPRIESIVMGRIQYPDQMSPWKNLFISAGFSPVEIGNFAETQGECLVKRTQFRGFRVEKRQAGLVLSWQRRELVSVSAWRC